MNRKVLYHASPHRKVKRPLAVMKQMYAATLNLEKKNQFYNRPCESMEDRFSIMSFSLPQLAHFPLYSGVNEHHSL